MKRRKRPTAPPFIGHNTRLSQSFVHSSHDSNRFSTLAMLHSHDSLLQAFFVGAVDAMLILNEAGQIVAINPAGCVLLGHVETAVEGRAIADVVTGLDMAMLLHTCGQQGRATGEICHLNSEGIPRDMEYVATLDETNSHILLVMRDMTERKQAAAEIGRLNAELEQRVTERTVELEQANHELCNREEQLQLAIAREQLLANLTQDIRRSLDLNRVLNATVNNVREVLKADRVLIYRFNADWSGLVAVESVAQPALTVLGKTLYDPCFGSQYVEQYQQGRVRTIADIYTAQLTQCHIEFLSSVQVRANLVVPILQFQATTVTPTLEPQVGDRPPWEMALSFDPALALGEATLWGLLIVHQCHQPRQWQNVEIALLTQLATQVGIAIQQAELYHQVQRLNVSLEHQVSERTLQLQQALDFEAMLKQITDSVRDSLDEDQILQAAVEALAKGLHVECCDTGIYNTEQTICQIRHEYTTSMPPAVGQTPSLTEEPHLYGQLISGQWVQFCSIAPDVIRLIRCKYAILACPIQDDQGVIGDLWLFRQREKTFNELEIRLVQQVANQCAIAIRQARLYQAVQAQVNELERLNQLKDDFLCTVSHELRTPMSNINLAVCLLEVLMQQEGLFETKSSQASRYLQILQDECQREIELINDLLDLQRLDAGTETLSPAEIQLQTWIPHLVEPFEARALHHNQQLEIQVSPDLPPLISDQVSLERIITELLNNACKYTPSGQKIAVFVQLQDKVSTLPPSSDSGYSLQNADPTSSIEIRVSNTGVVIPEGELPRVFDKFYRVPNSDPWKHGGTGLGLALVKKLTEHLGGSVDVCSAGDRVTFTIVLPLQ